MKETEDSSSMDISHKRRVSLRAQALRCHSRFQVELSPKTDASVVIELISNRELEGVVVDLVLSLKKALQLDFIDNYQVYELTRYICKTWIKDFKESSLGCNCSTNKLNEYTFPQDKDPSYELRVDLIKSVVIDETR
jgi:hypothetical protein